MNTDRHSQAEQKELIEDPEERARREALNGVVQFDLVLETIKNHVTSNEKLFQLKPNMILRLQDAALHGIHPLSGTFRNTPVAISGSKHQPPEPFSVSEEVADLCQYVNSNWQQSSALHLAAYILWKLNWIHPFADGNGRTARAVSYLVMSIKLDSVLPGTPTIPEQIAADKGPYYDALEAADRALAQDKTDVSKLESMLAEMLVRQLTGSPLLSEIAQNKLSKVIDSRIRHAPSELSSKCFDTEKPADQMWAIGDHLVLQVGAPKEISEAENRRQELGSPFPHLVSIGDAPAKESVLASETGPLFIGRHFDVQINMLFALERGASMTIQNIGIKWNDGKNERNWSVKGALYIVRLGGRINSDNLHSLFDALIARHLNFGR